MARILLVTQYYPPEMGAAAGLTADIAAVSAEAGHEVRVITALPNYPGGTVPPPYRGHWHVKERDGSIVVHRVWLVAARPTGNIRRLTTYLSFASSAFIMGLLARFDPDVVMADSPPLFVALVAALLARFKRARLVLNIEDLWPEAVAQIGAVSRGRLFEIATVAEEWTYRNATLIAGQTEGIVRSIRERVPTADVILLPAGVDTSAFAPQVVDPVLAREFGGDGSFIVGYAGLHGLWQALDTVLDAAKLLLARDGIRFLLIGDGPLKGRLQRRAIRAGLRNVTFMAPRPRSAIAAAMPLWGVGVVPLIAAPMTAEALPFKLYELMAAGVPAIFCGPAGEASELIARVGCGLTVPTGDARALADAVLELREDPQRAAQMGARGRAEAVRALDRRTLIRGLLDRAVGGAAIP